MTGFFLRRALLAFETIDDRHCEQTDEVGREGNQVKERNNTGRGSLNLNVRGLSQSATLAINEHSNALRGEGRRIYKMGLGQSPFPVPSVVVDALKLHAHEKDYLPVNGLPALCEAVAEFHRMKDRVEVHSEHVLVGPGSKELMFLLQVAFYGELLLMVRSNGEVLLRIAGKLAG